MKKNLLAFLAILSLITSPLSVLAWLEPVDLPPDGNVGAPIHIGGQAQTKLGALTILGDTSATVKGLMIGSNALILQNATQNLIYGNVDTTSLGNLLNLQVEGTTKFIIDKDGKVGIGTVAPTQKLDVAGSVVIPTTINSASGVIYKGGAPFIHNFNLAGTEGNNTFIGLDAGNFAMTGSAGGQGSHNTAAGQNALSSNTTGSRNTAIGVDALWSNTAGYGNTANGMGALRLNTTGNYNTANGMGALRLNTTGAQNTANGTEALRLNTTGYRNTASGAYSLYANTTGAQNTANGMDALRFNTTGNQNTANGDGALRSNTTGSYNTANGNDALRSNTIGNYNTAYGMGAGYSIATGGNNTFLGRNAGFNASQKINVVNSMALGDGTYTTADNQVVIGNASIAQTLLNGNVGIGVAIPTQKLDVAGDVNITGTYRVNGVPIAVGGGTEWTTSGNNIYNANIGNVGIGTSNPLAKLEVNLVNALGWGGNLNALKILSPDNVFSLGLNTYMISGGNVGYHFSPNGNTGLIINTAGSVGIGATTNPGYKLDVAGQINASAGLCISGSCKTAWPNLQCPPKRVIVDETSANWDEYAQYTTCTPYIDKIELSDIYICDDGNCARPIGAAGNNYYANRFCKDYGYTSGITTVLMPLVQTNMYSTGYLDGPWIRQVFNGQSIHSLYCYP